MLMTSAFRGQRLRSSWHTTPASRLWVEKLLALVIGRPPAVAPDIPAGDPRIGFGRIVKLTATSENGMKWSKRLRSRGRVAPLIGCLGSEDPQRGA